MSERGAAVTIEVTFVAFDGTRCGVAAPVGGSLMDAALDHGVAGIVAQCGGACTCATCHCHIDEAWLPGLPPPSDDERELLTYVLRPDHRSRLACQVPVSEALQGAVVYLPEYQQ